MLVSTAENGSYEFCDRWKSVYWNLKWRGRERLRLKKLMYYSAMDEVVRSSKIRIFRVSFFANFSMVFRDERFYLRCVE